MVAAEVSFDEYMEKYAAEFCEWFDGIVVKMSPVSDVHSFCRGCMCLSTGSGRPHPPARLLNTCRRG